MRKGWVNKWQVGWKRHGLGDFIKVNILEATSSNYKRCEVTFVWERVLGFIVCENLEDVHLVKCSNAIEEWISSSQLGE